MKKIYIIFALLFLLSGCSTQPVTTATNPPEAQSAPEVTAPAELFSNRDSETEYTLSSCEPLELSGSGTVTIEKEGIYLLSGELTDGMILVDAPKDSKIRLILDGVTVSSSNGAPIYIKQADKVFITLAEGSRNTLKCGEIFEAIDENNIDGAIFSKEDLTLNGSGSLTVVSPAGHGIVSKDDLRITGGSYEITAAGHGLTGKDAVSIADGDFTIISGKDGIQADHEEDTALGNLYLGGGSYHITAGGDGISASGTLYAQEGSYTLLCGGGSEYGTEHTDDMFGGGMGGFNGRPGGMGGRSSVASTEDVSAKGLKAAGNMTIVGGSYNINSADDGLHSNQNLTVTGGSFQIATGDDGLHADENLTVSSGVIAISDSYEGLEGLTIQITGGEITIKAEDDGLNAAGGNDESGFGGRPGGFGGGDRFGSSSDSFILITGGTLFVDADGDGIDSNGDLTFTGGNTIVEGPTNNGNGPLDYGGTGRLSGGTVVITGSSGMAQSLQSTDTQGVFAIRCGSCSAGTAFTISDSTGKEILTVTPQKEYSSIIVSTPEIIKEHSYTITLNEETAEFQAQ